MALTALACAEADRTAARGDFYSGENVVVAPYQHIDQWQFINNLTWRATDALPIKNIMSYGQFREATRSTVYGENLIVQTGPDAGKNVMRVMSTPQPGLNNVAQATFTEELQFHHNH